jgi:micrococcal nuclease
MLLFGPQVTMKILNVKKRDRITCLRVILVALFMFSFSLLPYITMAGQSYSVKVERIIDGDTIRVNYKEKSIKVRLWGIDTPEYHQAYSRAAKRFTTHHVKNSFIQLEIKDWDDYGRMVAIITMDDGRLLNEELVKNGLAWVHIYYCKEAICNTWYGHEKRARENRVGLWRDTSPIPPWEWKRKNKK